MATTVMRRCGVFRAVAYAEVSVFTVFASIKACLTSRLG